MTTHTCLRCGQCCSKGGPALHLEDKQCFDNNALDIDCLLTLRAGEMVHDQPSGKLITLASEIIKIKNKQDSTACLFYLPEQKSCAIYLQRPVECRVLECSNPEPLKAMYNTQRLTRRDLLPDGHPLLELMAAHDEFCSPIRLKALAQQVFEGSTQNIDKIDIDKIDIDEIGEMLQYDQEMRTLLPQRSGLPESTVLFFLGRPLAELLGAFGLRVEQRQSSIILHKNYFPGNRS